MTTLHTLGFPRIGAQRELKFALERHWRGEISLAQLEDVGRELRRRHWALQRQAGLDLVTVGDFAFYDHVLNHVQMLGCEPERFAFAADAPELARYFVMARGLQGQPALEMTKWFDTNYHYLVPEFTPQTSFHLASERLFDEVAEAHAAGHRVKVVLVGPLTFLWSGKAKAAGLSRLDLLERLLPVYRQILARLHAAGVAWVQLDEPILGLELSPAWRQGFEAAYADLAAAHPGILLATYFESLGDNLDWAMRLPVAGLHVDLARAPGQLDAVLARLSETKVLSLGLIDGRNVWRADLDAALASARRAAARLGDGARLWLAPSCSLLHVPLTLQAETALDDELKSWLAFAQEKLGELHVLQRALDGGDAAVAHELAAARAARAARQASTRIHDAAVARRLATLPRDSDRRASPFPQRQAKQRERFRLPPFPTTTIGSFPQTSQIRAARAAFKRGNLDADAYREIMRAEVTHAVRQQEALGLDVLVHGEPERNDMVEYFGEQLAGFAFTANGWVQSYGSRCVKPPIIFGDVSRPKPMTVEWATYAQQLTARPMKGMLTGPITLLQWSFARDDQPRADTAVQIALAIRDEVADLEAAGIGIIQIDEPAIREGLPLKHAQWPEYLAWATKAFRLCAAGAQDATQIHTHMCYSEFNDILPDIAAMDADVITIETSRSDMELLRGFGEFRYPAEIGPGVWDIHSPRVPSADEMVRLLEKAGGVIPPEHLWVNPDCGLKTRGWEETRAGLANMVEAARRLRSARHG